MQKDKWTSRLKLENACNRTVKGHIKEILDETEKENKKYYKINLWTFS